MRRVALLGLLALALPGCGGASRSTQPRADSRGTPLGPAGTFAPGNIFLWSAATNEIVGTGAFAGASPGALTAMHGAAGSTRVLDAEPGGGPVAGVSGTPVYYRGIVVARTQADEDTFHLRRVALGGGGPARIDACSFLCLYGYAVSGDGAWLAWTRFASRSPTPDSLTIENAASGTRSRIAFGWPELMSPDGSRLLYRAGPFHETRMMYDRATGTSTPFDLGLPAGSYLAGLRWDAAGVHALYLQREQQLWLRTVATGVAKLLYVTGDTLLASSGSWSPDGSHVALWSEASSPDGLSRTVKLHVVDVAARSGSVVATGRLDPPGPIPLPLDGIVFSPDSRLVAYQYASDLFVSAVPNAPAAPASPAPGFGSGAPSLADGRALGSADARARLAALERRFARSRLAMRPGADESRSRSRKSP